MELAGCRPYKRREEALKPSSEVAGITCDDELSPAVAAVR
jgi:hypothetical protein